MMYMQAAFPSKAPKNIPTIRLPSDDSNGVLIGASITKTSSTFICSLAIGENMPIWSHPVFTGGWTFIL